MNKYKKKGIIAKLMIPFFTIIFIFFILPTRQTAAYLDVFSYDVDTTAGIEFLSNHWLNIDGILGALWHALLGGIIKGLLIINSSIEALIPKTFDFFSFLSSVGLSDFYITLVHGLLYSILVFVVMYIGIKSIVYNKQIKFKNIGVQILIMFILIDGLNSLVYGIGNISETFYTDITKDDDYSGELSWEIVKENTADLLYLGTHHFAPIESDSEDISTGADNDKMKLTKEEFMQADLGSIIVPEVVDEMIDEKGSPEETKFLKYKITNDGTENQLEALGSGSIFNPFHQSMAEGYQRFPMNSLIIIISLLSLMIAYLFIIFKLALGIFELGIKWLAAPFIFATDIETGQKTKMLILDILNIFLMIIFTGLSLKYYQLLVAYLGKMNLEPLLYIVAMVVATVILIKGSTSILKYFGVDTSTKKDNEDKILDTIVVGSTITEKPTIATDKETVIQDKENMATNKIWGNGNLENYPTNMRSNMEIESVRESTVDFASKNLTKFGKFTSTIDTVTRSNSVATNDLQNTQTSVKKDSPIPKINHTSQNIFQRQTEVVDRTTNILPNSSVLDRQNSDTILSELSNLENFAIDTTSETIREESIVSRNRDN